MPKMTIRQFIEPHPIAGNGTGKVDPTSHRLRPFLSYTQSLENQYCGSPIVVFRFWIRRHQQYLLAAVLPFIGMKSTITYISSPSFPSDCAFAGFIPIGRSKSFHTGKALVKPTFGPSCDETLYFHICYQSAPSV